MTHQQKQSRQKKSQQLEARQLSPTEYLVQSQSDPSFFYKVILNGTHSCHCADFKRHHETDPAWTCKHIAAALDLKAQVDRVEARAVEEARASGQANGNGKPRFTPEERAKIQAGIDALYGKPARQEKALAPQLLGGTPAGGVPSEEAEPLEACSECGRLLPASEMIPLDWVQGRLWQAPNGSGLICPKCYQAHKGMASEMKAREEISPPRREVLPTPQNNQGPADLSSEPEASRTLTLAKAYPVLTRPFPINLVEVKPGSLNQEKTRALALAYVDMRAYQARLDEVVGPDGWSVGYRTLGDRAVICRLTVLGISREDVGEADPEACPGPRSGNANAWTSAVAQSEKAGLRQLRASRRYLYSLPRLWAEHDPQKKALKAPQTIVERMYKEARL